MSIAGTETTDSIETNHQFFENMIPSIVKIFLSIPFKSCAFIWVYIGEYQKNILDKKGKWFLFAEKVLQNLCSKVVFPLLNQNQLLHV